MKCGCKRTAVVEWSSVDDVCSEVTVYNSITSHASIASPGRSRLTRARRAWLAMGQIATVVGQCKPRIRPSLSRAARCMCPKRYARAPLCCTYGCPGRSRGTTRRRPRFHCERVHKVHALALVGDSSSGDWRLSEEPQRIDSIMRCASCRQRGKVRKAGHRPWWW